MPIMSLSFRRTVYPTLYAEVIDNPNGDLIIHTAGIERASFTAFYTRILNALSLGTGTRLTDVASNPLIIPDNTGGITTLADVASATTFNSIAVQNPLDLGAGNKFWVKCNYAFDVAESDYLGANAPPRITNPTTGSWTPQFSIPLATTLAGKDLYLCGTRIDLEAANATNKVTGRNVYGSVTGDITTVDGNPDDLTSAGLDTDAFTPYDCSAFHGLFIYVTTSVATQGALGINSVEVQAYYA